MKPIWHLVEQEIAFRTKTRINITESIALLGYHETDKSHTARERLTINSKTLAKMCISKFRYGKTININMNILGNKLPMASEN